MTGLILLKTALFDMKSTVVNTLPNKCTIHICAHMCLCPCPKSNTFYVIPWGTIETYLALKRTINYILLTVTQPNVSVFILTCIVISTGTHLFSTDQRQTAKRDRCT